MTMRHFVLWCTAILVLTGVPSAHAFALLGVQSKKTHLTDVLNLAVDATQPMSGNVTVESRVIGSGHTIVFQFDGFIVSPGVLTVIDDNVTPVASASLTASGNDVVVTLPTLADNKRVTISLDNVNGVGLNVSASMGFRVGDMNNSGTVNAFDIGSVKARAGQLAADASLKHDLNTTGIISAADISAVKARAGSLMLPPGNAAPVVNAGPNQAIMLPAAAVLTGAVSDDGQPNPPGALTFSWTKFSGPSTVTFDNAAATNTAAHFGAAGSYILRLTASDSQRSGSADVSVTVAPPAQFSISDATVAEGNAGTTALTFTVTLTPAAATTVSVQAATMDGTATVADGDYQANTQTLTFAPGVTSQTFTVLVNGDTIRESSETFTVNLSGNSPGTSIQQAQATGTITNDDPLPFITITDVTAPEGNIGATPFLFTVTLSNPSAQTVSVSFSTQSDTAAGGFSIGSDFSTTLGTVTFAPGVTTMTITVFVRGDAVVEGNERFLVNLSNAINATIADGTGVGMIVNDD